MPRSPSQHDAYCPGYGSYTDHAGLCRDQAGYPVHLDPDPLMVEEDELWDPALNEWVPRKSGLPALVTGLIAGLVVGIVLGFTAANVHAATPRQIVQPAISATAGVPRDVPAAVSGTDVVRSASAPPVNGSGVPGSARPRPAGSASEAGGAGTHRPQSIVRGVASYVGARFGPSYLALPGGPGHRVRICSAVRCVVRTSTDAGPALFEQRAGRVADISRADFARLCACSPESVGLIAVRIEYL